MIERALLASALFVGCAWLFLACGDGDGDGTGVVVCKPSEVTCLNARGGEVCSADGKVVLSFSCATGERCCDPRTDETCVEVDPEGQAGENSRLVLAAGCVGACQPGAKECVSRAVSRVCSEDGRQWVPVACSAGTGCDDGAGATHGTCVRTEPDSTVTVCDIGQTTCADSSTQKECEKDGSNWVYRPCPTGTTCEKDACVLDENVECAPNSGVCADKKTVRRCNDEGTGYEQHDCGSMDCIDGACRGPVCSEGERRCYDVREKDVVGQLLSGTYQPGVVYSCNDDGSAWDLALCSAGEVCVYDGISATSVRAFVEDLKTALQNDTPPPVFDVPETSRAACVEPECAAPFALRGLVGEAPVSTAGSFICGDPGGEDPLSSYSLCEGLLPYQTLHWANYACPAATECRYESTPGDSEPTTPTITGPVCAQTC